MHTRKLITALFILNFVLIGIAGYLWFLYKTEIERQKVEVVTKYVTNTVKRVVVRNPEIPFPTNLFSLFRRWQDLESSEYPKFIQNLRAFGCPEDVIRDIIITDIARLYRTKRDAILATNKPQYWTGGYSDKVKEQLKKLEIEQKALVKDLLGVDYDAEIEKISSISKEPEVDLFLDFLPPEKQQMVKQIVEEYEKKKQAVFQRCNWVLLETDRLELKRIDLEKSNALASVLTPEELNEYNIRHSEVAKDLRDTFGNIGLTEEEFRKIYQARLSFLNKLNPDISGNRAENYEDNLVSEYNSELKKILGENRYKKYEMSQSMDYNYLLSFKERFNLTDESFEKVYDFRKTLRNEISDLLKNDNLTPEQRINIAQALRSESEKTLKQLMGEEVYKAYIEYDSDYNMWFEELMSAPENQTKPQESMAVNTNAVITPPPFPFIPPPPPPPPPPPAQR